jgi:hypothetical protein
VLAARDLQSAQHLPFEHLFGKGKGKGAPAPVVAAQPQFVAAQPQVIVQPQPVMIPYIAAAVSYMLGTHFVHSCNEPGYNQCVLRWFTAQLYQY